MNRLSIIIPCLEADGRLDDTLASVLANRPDACEVIVVHRLPYDDPYDLEGEVQFVEGEADHGLVELINLGFAASRAEIAHVLGCGLEVEQDWTLRPVARFGDARVASVSPLVVDRRNDGRVLSAGVLAGAFGWRKVLAPEPASALSELSRLGPMGPLLAAGFYRKQAVEAVGGFEASVGAELADLDLAFSLAAAGYRSVVEPSARVIGTPADLTQRSAFQAGQAAERLFWRHVGERGATALLLHPLELASDFAVRLVRGGAMGGLLGRLAALREARRHVRHNGRLRQLAGSTACNGKQLRIDQPHVDERRRTPAAKSLAR